MNALIIVIGALLVLGAVCLGRFAARTLPTKGKWIANYPEPRKAVVVIDVQEDYTGPGARPPFPYPDSARVIQVLNRLAVEAAPRQILVIYVRHEFAGFLGRAFSRIFAHGAGFAGTSGCELDRRLAVGSSPVFTKLHADAFSSAEFEPFLVEHQVSEVYLTGLDAQYCVRQMARAALARGYKVNIVTDGILLRAVKRWDALLRQFQREGCQLVASPRWLA